MTINRTTGNIVGALTAFFADGSLAAAQFLLTLTIEERCNALDMAIGMLAREVELGCADSKIPVADYLSWMGLAAARAET